MRIIKAQDIIPKVKDMIIDATRSLTTSAKVVLTAALDNENNINASYALKTILENAEIAHAQCLPICQDTGMAVLFVTIGDEVFIDGNLTDALNESVRLAYMEGGFRMSVLDPITRINTKTNTPAIIHLEEGRGEDLEISFMPKGFGSENMSKLYMLTPAEGLDKVVECIVDTVRLAGSNPCPPIVVGVGLGGTAEKAMEVAKRQLLRDVNVPSNDKELANLEERCLKKINALNIGAQGFHGNTTALAVHIGKFPTHISALPVAVNIQCNAVRVGSVKI